MTTIIYRPDVLYVAQCPPNSIKALKEIKSTDSNQQSSLISLMLSSSSTRLWEEAAVILSDACPLLKGEVLPYSLQSVGPGADSNVQAVSPQVALSHPPGDRLPLLSARTVVTFPAEEHPRQSASTKLYCLAHGCEQLAQGCYSTAWQLELELVTTESALATRLSSRPHFWMHGFCEANK